jgi:hypothetical protein
MSMYVELLSSVLQNIDEPTPYVLLEDAIRCRVRVVGSDGPDVAGSLRNTLAFEVAYDRSLLLLCASKGIRVTAARFDHPEAERDRLERALAGVGIDLCALAPCRTPTN